jgi:acylphosphatase
MKMKLKVKIAGPKVHDVGYRYFLMSNALDMGLKGFNARNRMSGNVQEVVAMVEGDEEAIADFRKLVNTQNPEHSEVSSISFEDCDEEIMRASEYAQICAALQLNKAIPVLLDMRDDLKIVKDDLKIVGRNTDPIPQVLEEIKGIREDIQPGYAIQFRQVQADVRAIKERLGML